MSIHDFWLFITGRDTEMAEMEMAAQRFGEGMEETWKARRRIRAMIFASEMAYINAWLENHETLGGV